MVSKKHILFIVENVPVPFDKRVWSEAKALKEWGHTVSIISPKGLEATRFYEKIDGIDVYRHPMPIEATKKLGFLFEYTNALFWEFLFSILIFIKKPFQIIHAANPPDNIFLVALFFKLFGVKFIYDHHDICPENYLAKFNKIDMLYRLLLLLEKLSIKTADIVISTNESYRKTAIERGKKSLDKVFVVRNGPDLSRIPATQSNNNLKKGFDYLIVYVGTIGKQECIDVLLKAIHYITFEKNIKNIKSIIIGTGPDQANMAQLSKKMNLDGHVHFTGFIPYKDFYEILATADICVNPEIRNSFTDKSTMIKIMDYMVFGKPIVQFNVLEGKVTAGEASVYVENNCEVDFANAILNLLNDPNRRKKMGEIGRERILNILNWEKQKNNLLKAYEHLDSIS